MNDHLGKSGLLFGPFVAFALLAGCGSRRQIREAKEVATAFAIALTSRDSVAMDSIATPGFASAIRREWPDTNDARLRFGSAKPLVVGMASLSKDNVAVFVRAGTTEDGLFLGMIILLTSSSPPKVITYQLLPDSY